MKKKLSFLCCLFLVDIFCIPFKLDSTTYGWIRGRVVDEVTGEGVADVVVKLNLLIDMKECKTKSDKFGFFELPMVVTGMSYAMEVYIDKEPYIEDTIKVDVKVEKDQNLTMKDIIARHGGAIEGNVKFWDGRPLVNSDVVAYTNEIWPGQYFSRTDQQGNYRVGRIPPGLKFKVASYGCNYGYGRLIKDGFVVERDAYIKGVDFIFSDSATEIYGTVYSSSGTPISEATLSCMKLADFPKNSPYTLPSDNTPDIDIGDFGPNEDGSYSIKTIESGVFRIGIYGLRNNIISKKDIFVGDGMKVRMDILVKSDSVEFIFEKKNELKVQTLRVLANNQGYSSGTQSYSKCPKYIGDPDKKEVVRDAVKNAVNKRDCVPDNLKPRWPSSPCDISHVTYDPKQQYEPRQNPQTGRTDLIPKCAGQDGKSISLYPKGFEKVCGSLESTMFHEVLHVAGAGECTAYACTKACYSANAQDVPKGCCDAKCE